jgi:hypothetical protein
MASRVWAVQGVDLPEAFRFTVTKLGLTADVHGEGPFVDTAPTRVDCHVHVDVMSESGTRSQHVEVLPSPLHPERRTELDVDYEFEEQFRLALWLYRGLPSAVVAWPTHESVSGAWSLRDGALENFLRFSGTLLDFHEDRQAYRFARHVAPRVPGVLEDDELKIFFLSGHPINAGWLKARWPLMVATDLYQRARRPNEPDLGFLLLMMSLETLFADARSELSRRLAQRCAFLNGRNSDERKDLFRALENLYDRRSRLVHGDVFDRKGFLDISPADAFLATELVRVSILRFITLGAVKEDLVRSLDRAVFDNTEADAVQARVNDHWTRVGVDPDSLLSVAVGVDA